MGVLQFPQQLTGTVGFAPNIRYMVSTDSIGTITTAGYLNSTNMDSATPLNNADVVFALYNFNTTTKSGSFAIFTVSITASNGQITLTQWLDALSSNVMLNNTLNTMTSAGGFNLAKVNGTEASNAVTANGFAGMITTSSLTTAGGSSYVITWTNTLMNASTFVGLTLAGGTNTTENITIKCVPGSGTATITIYNNTASTALNGTIILNYVLM